MWGGGPVDALGMRRKRSRTLLLQNSTDFWWQFGESFLDKFVMNQLVENIG
jgi:hypothetical protein